VGPPAGCGVHGRTCSVMWGRRARRYQGDASRRPYMSRAAECVTPTNMAPPRTYPFVGAVPEPPLQRPVMSVMQRWCCATTCIGSFSGHGAAVLVRHVETRMVCKDLNLRTPRPAHATDPTGRQCRGDPVGRPAGPWWAGTRDDGVARRHDRPSPGAARRPLPGRERRLFVAPLGTDGSFLSAHATEQTLPAGNVGATRWVARRVRCTRADVFGDVGPACTTVPGRRTASPLHAVRTGAYVTPTNMAPPRTYPFVGAVRETICHQTA
jgi:hypothetical protein